MEKAETLQPACKHQILRLAELQADDFNKDRQLFLACRHDRERLCSKVQAGNGQVYRCLFQHKFSDEMSEGVSGGEGRGKWGMNKGKEVYVEVWQGVRYLILEVWQI